MAAIPFNFYNTFRSAAIRPKSPKEFFLLAPSNGLAKRHSRGAVNSYLTFRDDFTRGRALVCTHAIAPGIVPLSTTFNSLALNRAQTGWRYSR